MIAKLKEKQKAIELRKNGLSYGEILKEIHVAKSSLSLWLKGVGLSKEQKQRLTEKKLVSMKKGWETRHNQKVFITNEIKTKARSEIGKLSKRELWLIGTTLYWGEGSKEKEKSSITILSNSDPYLIKVFLKWLEKILLIPKQDIHFRIFLHENSFDRRKKVQEFWSKTTGFPINSFEKISWKKNKINTKRKNIGENYFGVLRVIIKRSTNLNRKISGWIEGIYNNCGVV